MIPRPLFPKPFLVERPWGGSKLQGWGREVPPGSPCGESWDLGSVAGCDSPLSDAPFDTLSEAAAFQDGKWLGCGPEGFPLLVKLIDAKETLSVQVHPADSGPGWSPKNECWVVLEAAPGAFLYAGTSTDLSAEETVRRLHGGDISVLRKLPVQAGDVVVIPAGTIHAITGGLVIAEIQQCSDTTYRVYDWGRLGLDGKPRDLHLEASVSCLDPRPRTDLKPSPMRLSPESELLCATPWFALERWTPNSDPLVLPTREGFQILQVLDGPGRLSWDGNTRTCPRGQCILLPAGLPVTLTGGTWLRTFQPESLAEIESLAQRAGAAPEQARALCAGTFGLSRP